VIRVYDEAGNVIETHEHAGDFTSHERYVLNQKAPHVNVQRCIVKCCLALGSGWL